MYDRHYYGSILTDLYHTQKCPKSPRPETDLEKTQPQRGICDIAQFK